jgi:hypothetical protein
MVVVDVCLMSEDDEMMMWIIRNKIFCVFFGKGEMTRVQEEEQL